MTTDEKQFVINELVKDGYLEPISETIESDHTFVVFNAETGIVHVEEGGQATAEFDVRARRYSGEIDGSFSHLPWARLEDGGCFLDGEVTRADLLNLAVGEVLRFGGGAAPDMFILRAADVQPASPAMLKLEGLNEACIILNKASQRLASGSMAIWLKAKHAAEYIDKQITECLLPDPETGSDCSACQAMIAEANEAGSRIHTNISRLLSIKPSSGGQSEV